MSRMTLMMVSLLSGCWLADAEIVAKYDADPDLDSSSDRDSEVAQPGELRIVSVSPVSGSTRGGDELTITLAEAVDHPVVRIGGASAEVLSMNGERLFVRSPRGTEGAADVVVATGPYSTMLDDGFWYWQDGTDKYGIVGEVVYVDYTGDLEQLGYVDRGDAWLSVVEPSTVPVSSVYGDLMDRCTLSDSPQPYEPFDIQAQGVEIDSAAQGSAYIDYDAHIRRFVQDTVGNNIVSSTTYDLRPFDTIGGFPSFGVSPLVTVPASFAVAAPDLEESHLLTDRRGAFVPRNFELRWTTSNPGDYIGLLAVRWANDASTPNQWVVRESARCLITDDGSFSFPGSSLWVGYELGAPIDLYVTRIQGNSVQLPHNRSLNGVVGGYQIAGTVWQL